MNVVVYHGSESARQLIYDTEWHFKDQRGKIVGGPRGSNGLYKFNVLVTTYEVCMIESAKLSSIKWMYTIIDEGHRIKVGPISHPFFYHIFTKCCFSSF